MFRYLFPSGLAHIQQLWVDKELEETSCAQFCMKTGLRQARWQPFTALPSPLGCSSVLTSLQEAGRTFPRSSKLLEHCLFYWRLLNTTPQTFSNFVLIWLFLTGKKRDKRERVMLNFPCGARQGNTMGVLCPGGMQGIPKMGTGPLSWVLFIIGDERAMRDCAGSTWCRQQRLTLRPRGTPAVINFL